MTPEDISNLAYGYAAEQSRGPLIGDAAAFAAFYRAFAKGTEDRAIATSSLAPDYRAILRQPNSAARAAGPQFLPNR